VAGGVSDDVTFFFGGARGLDGEHRLSVPAGDRPFLLAAGDYDGDGALDAVAASSGSRELVLLRGSRERAIAPEARAAGGAPLSLERADFDGDGFSDLVLGTTGPAAIHLFRGGQNGLRAPELATQTLRPEQLAAGDVDGDGFPDLLVADAGASSLRFLAGHAGGLSFVKGFQLPRPAVALAKGDLDGDGFDDLAVLTSGSPGQLLSGSVLFLRQRYLNHHLSVLVGPGLEAPPAVLLDPRHPAEYRLEGLHPQDFEVATQVIIVPSALFELPQGPAWERGAYLTAVSDAAALMPEEKPLLHGARLTLRLRDHDPTLIEAAEAHPESLRVICKPARQATGKALAIPVELLDFPEGRGRGAAFRIEHLGTYVLALERARVR
jgi:hypothetical protein